MSNLKINIRLFCLHLQVHKDWSVAIKYNPFYKGHKGKWFEVFQFNP